MNQVKALTGMLASNLEVRRYDTVYHERETSVWIFVKDFPQPLESRRE